MEEKNIPRLLEAPVVWVCPNNADELERRRRRHYNKFVIARRVRTALDIDGFELEAERSEGKKNAARHKSIERRKRSLAH